MLMTEDCGDTWTPVNLGLDIVLEDVEIIEGQGFLVGDLGEAFNFSNPTIASFQLFEQSVFSVDFNDVILNTSASQTVTVGNPGSAELFISDVALSAAGFTVTPNSAAIPAGDSMVFTVEFTPPSQGAFSATAYFTHDAACYQDSVALSATGIEDNAPGNISGTVYFDGAGLPCVTVTLLDTSGILADSVQFPPIQTDSLGQYAFTHVPPDSYQVMIVEPLGYAADANPKVADLVPGESDTVNFYLTATVCNNNARSPGYWKHQFSVYICGGGHAHESEQELIDYIAKVHQHYTPHFDIFEGKTTFRQWRKMLKPGCRASMYKRARRQLAALVLNFVSLKIGQYTVVTNDGRTAGDVLTYCSILLTDGDPQNDQLAKNLAEKVNLRKMIPAGLIPESNILYKGGSLPRINWDFSDLPSEFSLKANYPNPFNPTTTIAYELPEAARVTITIYNVLGQKVARLVNDYQEAGRYQTRFDASQLASGIYLYHLQAGRYNKVRKMILMK
ncbi:MAG: hypothetical protein Kow0042_04220 [Calditrichia bacterium]